MVIRTVFVLIMFTPLHPVMLQRAEPINKVVSLEGKVAYEGNMSTLNLPDGCYVMSLLPAFMNPEFQFYNAIKLYFIEVPDISVFLDECVHDIKQGLYNKMSMRIFFCRQYYKYDTHLRWLRFLDALCNRGYYGVVHHILNWLESMIRLDYHREIFQRAVALMPKNTPVQTCPFCTRSVCSGFKEHHITEYFKLHTKRNEILMIDESSH